MTFFDPELFDQVFDNTSETLDLIAQDMEQKKMSKNKLSKLARISRKRVAKIFKNKRPTKRELRVMVKIVALGGRRRPSMR